MDNLKTSWYLWWGWSPEKVENWLEYMVSKEWQLYHVDMWGTRFKFKKSAGSKVRYCTDFQSNQDDQYMKLFHDDGWELIWKDSFGWYIWKKCYAKDRPSIYTDSSSLIERNNRLIKLFIPAFYLLLAVLIFLIIPRIDTAPFKFLFWVYSFLLAFFGVILFQFKKSNAKLKDNNIKE